MNSFSLLFALQRWRGTLPLPRLVGEPKVQSESCDTYLACSRIYLYYTRICSSRHTKTSPIKNMLNRVSKSVKRWMELTSILQLHRPCIKVSNKFSNYMEAVRNYSTREGGGVSLIPNIFTSPKSLSLALFDQFYALLIPLAPFGHHHFWSIVLDDLWSKNICRPKMIVWSPVLHSS